MIASGLSSRYVSGIFINAKNYGVEKGKVLERLSSGKTGDRASGGVSIVEASSSIISGTSITDNQELGDIDKHLKELDEIERIITAVRGVYHKYYDIWDKAVTNQLPNENGKRASFWSTETPTASDGHTQTAPYNDLAKGWRQELESLLKDPIYKKHFAKRGDNRYQTVTFNYKNNGLYSESVTVYKAHFRNIAHTTMLDLHQLDKVIPGTTYGAHTSNWWNVDNHVGSMRYSYRVFSAFESTFKSSLEKIGEIKTKITESKENILRQIEEMKKKEDLIFFNGRSIHSVLKDKKESKTKIAYYNSMMDTMYEGIDMVDQNVQKILEYVKKTANGDINIADPEIRKNARSYVEGLALSVKNIINNSIFDSREGPLVNKEEIVLSGVVDNKKWYLYQNDSGLIDFLDSVQEIYDDDLYKVFMNDTEDGGIFDDAKALELKLKYNVNYVEDLYLVYGKDSILSFAENITDDIRNNKFSVFSMMMKLGNVDYLHDLSINNLEYVIDDVENIDIQEETMDLMKIEVLESVSSEAVMKIKDSAKVLMRLIQG